MVADGAVDSASYPFGFDRSRETVLGAISVLRQEEVGYVNTTADQALLTLSRS